jgi:hypothetical protein
MAFFSSRPNFEDRQIVQWMGESVNLSGHTNFDMSGYNTYFYNSYTEYLEGISGGTGYQNYLNSFYTLSGDTFEGDDSNPTSGFTQQPTLIPGYVRITPPRGIIYSGNTNIISGYTALQDVTNFIATSYDSTGTIIWRPLSGITSMSGSCTPDFYVGTIHPCSSGGTVTIEGNLLVRGETISATTIIETETILVEDNNISMNYGGNHTTAIGGGITVLSGVSNSQHSIIATDSNGIFVVNPGLSADTVDVITELNINNLFTGTSVSILGITSGGTVIDGSGLYGEICNTCSGNVSGATIIGSGTTEVGVGGATGPSVVDCISTKCCSEWKIYYKDRSVETTNYDLVLKYKEAYGATVICIDANSTEGGVEHGTTLSATTVDTGGVRPVTEPIVRPFESKTTRAIRLYNTYKSEVWNSTLSEISNTTLGLIEDSAYAGIDTSFKSTISESYVSNIQSSLYGYIKDSGTASILASENSQILDGINSAIIGSKDSTISGGTSGTTIVGGDGIVATESYTTYVNNLNIQGTLDNFGTSIGNLGIDSDGKIVAGTIGSFTGNTSGDCISDIHVSNIHSCSPLRVNPNNEGDIYFGSLSANTLDLTNNRLGLGIVASGSRTSTAPLDTLELGEGEWLGFNTTISPSANSTAGIHFKEGISQGFNGYGVDMYYSASAGTDRLIIAGVFNNVQQGGMTVQRDGRIGVGLSSLSATTISNTFQIGDPSKLATLKFVDGNQAAGYVLTSDVNGVATWQTNVGVVNFGNTDLTLNGDRLHDLSGNTLTFTGGTTAFMGSVGVKTLTPSFDFEVAGSFGAESKSFVIPHPTKEGKKLVYGAIEGPEFGVYVRGKISNIIELPDYWTELVDENTITVQLTGDGIMKSPYVKEIKDNKVFVGNRFPFISPTGFYTVYGERKDIDKIKTEIDV